MVTESTTPTPHHWTLRFKHHKTTLLLYVEPTQSFPSIKSDLLSVLQSTNHTTLPGSSQPLPSDPEDLKFGIPVDKHDLSKGWVDLEIPETEETNGVGAKGKSGGKKNIMNTSPLGAGLKNGGMLAFRIRGGDGLDDEDGMAGGEDEWDVLLPSYEDEYGSQSQG